MWNIDFSYPQPMIYHCMNAIREDSPTLRLLSIYYLFKAFYSSARYNLVIVSCTPPSCSSTPTSSTKPSATLRS